MKVGSKVTKQPRNWFDGKPIQNWPDAQFVGQVLKVEEFHGCTYATVKYPSGRKQYENASELQVVT